MENPNSRTSYENKKGSVFEKSEVKREIDGRVKKRKGMLRVLNRHEQRLRRGR